MIRRISLVLGLILIALGFTVPAAAQTGTARVRVIHASPNAPAVDVFLGDQAVLTNVSFYTASDYLDVPAGTADLAIAPAGQGRAAAVATASPSVTAGSAYTVAAVGLLDNLQLQLYTDDLSAPASGNAHVRVIHASPDAPAVAVKTADGQTLIDSLAFPNASNYLPVPAGTYNIQVTPAGANDVVLDLSGTQLQAGTIYDVIATGELANIAAQVETFTPQQNVAGASGGDNSQAPSAPGTLPNTGAGDSLSLALIGVGLLALVGGFVLRRRVA